MDTFIFLFCAICLAVGLFFVIRHFIRQHIVSGGPPANDLARALKIIWVDTYKQDLSKLPTLEWVTGSALNCAVGAGWYSTENGACVAGVTYVDQRLCRVAWNLTYKLSTCSLAHELAHFYMFLIGLPQDPNHTSAIFAAGGIKDQANAALAAAGL